MSMSISKGSDPDRKGNDEEDMSIESLEDGEEEYQGPEGNGTFQAEPLPTIQLSFDNSRGGAWDDRELVNAYDAAMEEFHVCEISQISLVAPRMS